MIFLTLLGASLIAAVCGLGVYWIFTHTTINDEDHNDE
jgi:hypothetical protein